MSAPSEPDRGVFQRTFVAEATRAVAAGVIETSLATFAVFIAVTRFESGPAIKALLLGSPALGLLGSLLVVPLVVRLQIRASRAAAGVSFLSMGGFILAASLPASEPAFIVGTTLGMGAIGMAIPLQTHYLRINYPSHSRGRLFSIAIVLRALTALLVSWGFGEFLESQPDRYPVLLWSFVAAAFVSGCCQFLVPSEAIQAGGSKKLDFLQSVKLSSSDKGFVLLLIGAMVLGVGVLSSNALRVDYLVNPEHGLNLDVKTVSLITGIVPSLVRLVSTFFWGWLFDRMDFFVLRILVNIVFLAGILLYFVWSDVRVILVGSALFGMARGGGEILFNLFVTKIAPSANVASYMSVHTSLAGIRILAAPFIGFFLVQWANIPVMVVVCSAVVIVSIFIVRRASVFYRKNA